MAITSESELDQLLESLQEQIDQRLEFGSGEAGDTCEEDNVPEKDKIVVRDGIEVGSIWQLGKHQVMCGDSFDQSHLDLLFQDKLNLIKMVLTDPPYGISLKTDWSGAIGLSSQDTNSRVHPTQKPLEVNRFFLDKFSVADEIIADLFLGSGSTLIACEKTNRICYGMELSPAYIEIILQRWEQLTKESAVKIN